MNWKPDVPLKHSFNVGKTFDEKGFRYERLLADNPEHVKSIESEGFQDLTWSTFVHFDDMMISLPDERLQSSLDERQIRTEAIKTTLKDQNVTLMVAYHKDFGDRPVGFSLGKLFESPEDKEAHAVAWYIGVHPDARRLGLGRDMVHAHGKMFNGMAEERGLNLKTYFAEAEHPGRVDTERAAADPISPEDRFKWYVSQGAKIAPVDYHINWNFSPQFHEVHRPEGSLAERVNLLEKQAKLGKAASVDDVEDPNELSYCLMSFPVKGQYATPEQVKKFIVAYHTDTYQVGTDHSQLVRMVKEAEDWKNASGNYKDHYLDPIDVVRSRQVNLTVQPEYEVANNISGASLASEANLLSTASNAAFNHANPRSAGIQNIRPEYDSDLTNEGPA